MAIGLPNYVNVSTPDSDYPDGNIKDNPGDNSGTPFDKNTYTDIHQVFAKILRLADVAASGLPENEYSGFQYLDSMRKLFCDPGMFVGFDRSSSLVAEALFNPLINVLPGSPNSGDISLPEAAACEYDSLCVTIRNDSSNSVDVFPFGSDTIDGTSSLTIGAGDGKKLCLDRASDNWIIINSF